MNTRTSDCLRAGESVMNNVLARCSHLFPSLREVWYAIPLRLIVGYGFMEHGYAKLARGPDDFAGILHALGMPAPILLSWTTVIVELLGGLAVFVGAFLPLASVPMAFVLLVATFTVHLPNGFSSIKLQSVTEPTLDSQDTKRTYYTSQG
jgi:uncharacterized membrane protein YphA (DoxX/SURF4 family)